VFVHGGGWVSGNKRDSRWLDVIRDPLLASGFAVASIDYRLAPAHQWPAPLEDVRCAIRSLRARASEYGLDPSRVGIWGTSAGGHLAALAATVDEGQFEGDGEHAGHSSRVQAVVDLYGPADLTDGAGWPPGHGAVLQLVFGAHDLDDQVLVEASPTTYVSPDDPPALILHGDQDLLVPLQQSQTLFNRLAAAAVDAELVVVENAGHGLEPSGGTMRPSEAELVDQIVAFLETQLR
jgi:acetyl esterase/lipase